MYKKIGKTNKNLSRKSKKAVFTMWFALVWPILYDNFTLTNEIKSTEYFEVMATTRAIRRMCMENFFEEINL